jgi:aminocarboxymuconate-semialdehyde decarboxylase
MIIDIHSHYVPQALVEDLKAQRHGFPSVKATNNKGLCLSFVGNKPTRPLMPLMSDVDKRRQWFAEQQIGKQVVGGWLDMFAYELPPEEGADWSRYLNDHLRKGVAQVTELIPLATVPMQSGKLAAKVLEEALYAGFHGAMIGTQPKGRGGDLDDADLAPFWEVASTRKTTLLLHPMFAVGDDRLRDYGLVNAIGRLTDTTHAVARLLYSGHLTRYPGVKLVLSHGGAAIPFAIGRLQRSYQASPTTGDPAEGFRTLYFDSIVFDPHVLRFVCEVAGFDKLMMGSDFPFSVGDLEPLKIVDACKFDKKQRRAIVSTTAADLFHIDVAGAARTED